MSEALTHGAQVPKWDHVAELSRAEIYERMAAPGGSFEEGVAGGKFRTGSGYALRTVTGEKWDGRVEFIFARREF